MKTDELKTIESRLWKDPSEKAWASFAATKDRAGARYYKVFYEKGKLANKEDLRDSYVQLFDSKERPIMKVPVYLQENGKIRGATIYLKGLLNINK